jgi:hypothetical protein
MPGDFDALLLYGAGLGFDIYDNLELGYRYIRGDVTNTGSDLGSEADNNKYSLQTHSLFCEYRYRLPVSFPLSVTGGGSLGFTLADWKKDWVKDTNNSLKSKKDKGLSYYVNVGVQYDATQKISLFTQIGYQGTTYMDKYITDKISTDGVQLLFGVKYNVWGVNKSMYDEY